MGERASWSALSWRRVRRLSKKVPGVLLVVERGSGYARRQWEWPRLGRTGSRGCFCGSYMTRVSSPWSALAGRRVGGARRCCRSRRPAGGGVGGSLGGCEAILCAGQGGRLMGDGGTVLPYAWLAVGGRAWLCSPRASSLLAHPTHGGASWRARGAESKAGLGGEGGEDG